MENFLFLGQELQVKLDSNWQPRCSQPLMAARRLFPKEPFLLEGRQGPCQVGMRLWVNPRPSTEMTESNLSPLAVFAFLLRRRLAGPSHLIRLASSLCVVPCLMRPEGMG